MPEVERYVLDYYVNKLTGKVLYVTYNRIMDIIDHSGYTKSKEVLCMKENNTVYTTEQIKMVLSPIFQTYNVQSAILFGSYAKGTPRGNSDIDILVDSNLHGLAFYGLLEDVVTSLNKSVDLIDRLEVVPDSEIDNEIKKSGVLIYGAYG